MELTSQTNKLLDLFPVVELVLADKLIRAKIDTADLPKVLARSTRWNAYWHPGSQTHYVYNDRGRDRVFLHRLVTDACDGLVVDHIQHDGLDNRQAHLRVVIQGENVRNARRAPGKYGRGVTWREARGKFQARVKVAGREISLGYFDNSQVAADKVREFAINAGVSL